MDNQSVARSSRPDTPYEQRECHSCYGTGRVLLDAEYDPGSGELTQETTACFICAGMGSVSIYRYRTPRPRS